MDFSQLPRVQESILKKRRRNIDARAQREKEIAKQIKGKRFAKKTFFKRAERLAKEHKKADRFDVRLDRETKKPDTCKVKPRGDLAFVVRIRGVKDVPDKANRILRLLRLTKLDEGVFLRLNKTTLLLLDMVDMYITWGHPHLRIVRELIFKRGQGRTSSSAKRKPLTDNTFIEEALGQHDIVCMEDIVHEIFTQDSPNFKAANDFLYHFKLNTPISGWRNKQKHYKDGGDFGCRFDEINSLLKTII